jgi:hypothetical protein
MEWHSPHIASDDSRFTQNRRRVTHRRDHYSKVGQWGEIYEDPGSRFEPDPIIDSVVEALFASEGPLGCLHKDMSQQEFSGTEGLS